MQENQGEGDKGEHRILKLKDNLALTGYLERATLEGVARFVKTRKDWDVVHLGYIPYISNLRVSKRNMKGLLNFPVGLGCPWE